MVEKKVSSPLRLKPCSVFRFRSIVVNCVCGVFALACRSQPRSGWISRVHAEAGIDLLWLNDWPMAIIGLFCLAMAGFMFHRRLYL